LPRARRRKLESRGISNRDCLPAHRFVAKVARKTACLHGTPVDIWKNGKAGAEK
jgi:hypothetical protein